MSAVRFEFNYHTVTHAKLMSNMRTPSIGPPIFHYGNICHWMDLANNTGNILNSQRILTKQLACRALIQIIRLKHCAVASTRKIGSDYTIEKGASNCFREFIDDQYCCLQQNTFAGTFVDGLDIFAAGVLVTSISSTIWPADCTNNITIVHKCTALLSSVGSRFLSFNVLPRALWALSDAPLQGSLQHSVRPNNSKLYQ